MQLASLTDVCAIYEAEEVEEGHRRHDVAVNLPSQLLLFFGVEHCHGRSGEQPRLALSPPVEDSGPASPLNLFRAGSLGVDRRRLVLLNSNVLIFLHGEFSVLLQGGWELECAMEKSRLSLPAKTLKQGCEVVLGGKSNLCSSRSHPEASQFAGDEGAGPQLHHLSFL